MAASEASTASGPRTLQRWGWAAGLCLVLVAVSLAALDRPIALWTHAHLRDIPAFVWLTYIPEPLPPLAGTSLVVIALAAAAGRQPGRAGEIVLRLSLGLIAATAIKDQLKYLFGRTWPETWVNHNPSFIGDGTFGFWPLHGGVAYASFPSGHTTAVCSVAAVLWIHVPSGRPLWTLAVGLVAVGLLGADYHWLSDIVAGGFLGTAAGVTASTLGAAPAPSAARRS